ncbi:MAG: hypothetical protein LC123_06860 [Burkholderiales bacterium]|nr:hypothetical protein [Anaerolineae bacterium]MCZ2419541.1 hypothetical protein [Burkholderiales bacterium]
MTKTITPRKELENLDDALIDDLLATPDSDFLEEVKASGRDPRAAADRVRAIVEQGRTLAAKSKLRAAKAAVAASQAMSVRIPSHLDAAHARQLIKELSANDPEFRKKMTLAARNEEDLSDEDVLGIIEDLRELGVLPDEDGIR